MNDTKGTQKIHFFYIIAGLILIIIGLISYKLGDKQEVVNYISFALTITSLFLGLISIVYAFYSNSSLSQTLGQLDSASSNINETSNKLTATTIALNQQIESIPSALKKLEGKLDNTHKLVREAVYSKGILPQKISDTEIPKEVFDKFFRYSSLSGLFILYATHLSCKNKKPFSLNELKDSFSFIDVDYANGFLVACSSLGFFTRKDYSEYWTIPNFNSMLSMNLSDKLDERINSLDQEDKDFLIQQKKEVEEFFEPQ